MSTQQPAREPMRRPSVRLLPVVAGLLVVAFTVTTVPGFRSTTTFHTGYDGWLQGTTYVVIAVVALVRPLADPAERLLWWLVATAVSLRALGFVLYLGWVRMQHPPPYPSAADFAWLSMDAVLLLALWVLLRVRMRQRSVGIAFDAVFGGLTVAGAAVALQYRTLDTISGAELPNRMVATDLAYPLLDVGMLMLLTGALITTGLRARSTVLLAIGVAGFAVVDAVYVYRITAETYHPGTLLAALSLAATLALALSGWMSGMERPLLPSFEFSQLAVSAVFGLIAIATMVYAALHQVTLAGLLLPAAALVVGIARAVWTVLRNTDTAVTVISAQNAELVRFQALVETSDDFIAMARPDGAVIYVNPAGRRLVGIDDRDVTEMNLSDFQAEDGPTSPDRSAQTDVVSAGRWSGPSLLRDHRGGPPIPVAVSSFLMRDPATGEPYALATVQRDMSDRVAAQATLEHLADQRRHLLDRLVQAQEDERARIAADVHDDSVQALAAVELRLGLLRRQLAHAPTEQRETADDLAETVRTAIERLRALLFDLESPAVETDLGTALAVAAENTFGDHLRWRISGDTTLELPDGQQVTAYRIAREAMANVVRHASARSVEIRIGRAAGGVEVVVEDDGEGFDPATVEPRPGHLGIPAMADRATIAGGRLDIEQRAAGGTRVRLWLPSAPGPEGPA